MSLRYSLAVRNAKLDAIETAIGTSAVLKIRSGSVPASCAAIDTGVVLATVSLPVDWMADASGGSKSMSGSWEDSAADADGTASYFRIYDSGGATCHIQGTVGTSGADMIVDSTDFHAGQAFTVTAFTIADNNG